MRQLARFAGIGPFLLGAGLQVTGWVSPAIGVSLMALGAAWTLVALAGPSLADRTMDAIATDVAKRLAGASKEAQEVDRQRWLKGVTQRMLAELTVARERFAEAQAKGRYWDPTAYTLASDEWAASHQAASDEPELAPHYMDVRLAFEELNRINAVITERRNHPVWSSSAVDPSDRLVDAIGRVDEGVRLLKQVGDSL